LIGVIPIVVLLTVNYGRYLGKLRKKFQDELASSNVISEESISSMRTIRSFGAEEKVSNSYEGNISKSFNIGILINLN
jgi:ABC-type bacteriocin/lantibiotic exporter with double-glycine peptidase domain